jgi:Family of unknown function (DUF6191)
VTQWGLDTLFNPAKRHMDEEKRRLQATRQQVGDTSGGKRIDLESGKVRIKPGAGADDVDAEDANDAADSVESDATEATGSGSKNPAAAKSVGKKPAAKKELTPAQLRAAQRRGRAPR